MKQTTFFLFPVCGTLLLLLVLLPFDVVEAEPEINTTATACPTRWCRCDVTRHVVDCRNANLTDLDDVIAGGLDPATQTIDLRGNLVSVVRRHQFNGLANLSTILLDDNVIDELEEHAFHGIGRVRLVSLAGNRLRRIVKNAFGELVGESSSSSQPSSVIDLRRNDVEVVEKEAFAWIRNLDVMLGGGGGGGGGANVTDGTLMTVNAYAFYGARDIGRLQIGQVGSVRLNPRMFTNVEQVGHFEIVDTSLDGGSLDPFVFEGLRSVVRISFDNVNVSGSIKSYAFSGLVFSKTGSGVEAASPAVSVPAAAASTQRGRRQRRIGRRDRSTSSSSDVRTTISFRHCRIGRIETDAFRDANVAHIVFERTSIGRVESRAFRGVDGLHMLRIAHCHFAGSALAADSLGGLRGLHRIQLDDNSFTSIDRHAFHQVSDVDHIHIRFHRPRVVHSDTTGTGGSSSRRTVTIRQGAFDGVTNIGHITVSGGVDGNDVISTSSTVLQLQVEPGAFGGLVGVETLVLEHFNWPTIAAGSLEGLGRIANLTISDCSVAVVERDAFGDPMTSQVAGAIEHLNLGTGNRLTCDCASSAWYRHLETRFVDYVAYCRLNASSPLVDVHDLLASGLQQRCTGTSNLNSVGSSNSGATQRIALTLMFSLTLLALTMTACSISSSR